MAAGIRAARDKPLPLCLLLAAARYLARAMGETYFLKKEPPVCLLLLLRIVEWEVTP